MNDFEKNKIIDSAIRTVAKKALASSIFSKKGREFFTNAAFNLKSASQKRDEFEQKGIHIPPFLIASIATACNLQCRGCYAQINSGCGNNSRSKCSFEEMTSHQWENIFTQASDLGISFVILAGGEPMMRKDVLETASRFPSLIFPVFTNGTLFDGEMIDFFDNHRNLIPVLSLEGNQMMTDSRRGAGVYDKIQKASKELYSKGILFGVSVTVTTENMNYVTDSSFVSDLANDGCTALFYIEYVPADDRNHLAPEENDLNLIGRRVSSLRDDFSSMIIVSFPGDEQYLGGCLAAGIGFFHINAFGGAEPCPFSPYSDISLKTHSLIEAINSPLFEKIKAEGLLKEKQRGGCTLFAQKETVESLSSSLKIEK